METPLKQEDFSKKVMDGFRLAHKRLVEKAKREDDTLVIERDACPCQSPRFVVIPLAQSIYTSSKRLTEAGVLCW